MNRLKNIKVLILNTDKVVKREVQTLSCSFTDSNLALKGINFKSEKSPDLKLRELVIRKILNSG